MNLTKHLSCVLIALCMFSGCMQKKDVESMAESAPVKLWAADKTRNLPALNVKRGLTVNTPKASPGYVLFHPTDGTSSYLMGLDGQIVHEWKGDLSTMNTYLQDDGRIFRLERDPDFPVFDGGGQAGIIREYNWEGDQLWEFEYATGDHLTHHDIEVLPNGNILAIAWEAKSKDEAVASGRNPELTPEAGVWPDKIIEIKPERPIGGQIVWEWHLWDHLVQDFDPEKLNYGKIMENPRKVDINAHAHAPEVTSEQVEEMKKMGMLTNNATKDNQGADITHVNAVSYNPARDQIAISSPHYHEIWIIDHSTTTEEAKGNTGGRWGHGGDLLYRWGCDANYERGTPQDQKLFGQHDVKWIPEGYPGAGNLLVYNNDVFNPKSKFPHAFAAFGAKNSIEISIADLANYSAVYEWAPQADNQENYITSDEGQFGPQQPAWTYVAVDTFSFYSPFVSGAQRMKNGHTFITEGATGRLFEVTPAGEIVWEYFNPYNQQYRLPNGYPAQPVGPFMFAQFRGIHIPANHPALAGRNLGPIEPQPEPFTPPAPPSAPGG